MYHLPKTFLECRNFFITACDKKHLQHPLTYYHVNSCWCPVCLYFHHSITRVRNHLKSKRCFHLLLLNFKPLSPEWLKIVDQKVQQEKATQSKSGFNVRKAHFGPVPVCGPQINLKTHGPIQYPSSESKFSYYQNLLLQPQLVVTDNGNFPYPSWWLQDDGLFVPQLSSASTSSVTVEDVSNVHAD